MKDILQEIIANKRKEIAEQKIAVPLQTLVDMGAGQFERPVRSMRKALEESATGIIAEFKRKSPSKGWIFPDATVQTVVPAYEKAGASACSILTDNKFFGGSLNDLRDARKLANIPLLRKDFIIDEYQLYQARIMGADAVLLIAAALTEEECSSLAEAAHSLDLEVLLEIHSEDELSYLTPNIDMLGINNRNLGTFHTDVENSFRVVKALTPDLSPLPPHKRGGEKALTPSLVERGLGGEVSRQGGEVSLISESGISDTETIKSLRKEGFRGFLIGETFMKTGQPGESLSQFIKELS